MERPGQKLTKFSGGGETSEAKKARRRRKKAELVALKGGACERCSGSFHQSLFEFHHRSPKGKGFGLNSGTIADKPWEEVLKEAEKCHLLCANCHREVHAFDDRRYLEE